MSVVISFVISCRSRYVVARLIDHCSYFIILLFYLFAAGIEWERFSQSASNSHSASRRGSN